MDLQKARYLIAYFSRAGGNYLSGGTVNLTVGNTEVAAGIVHDITKGDMFRIEAVNAYPKDYRETTEAAQKELRENARPKLAGSVEGFDAYDVIFLGYPNWWGTMPMPVFTFLEQYDFAGKTIAPFCTHEGSGLGRSVADIKKLCPGSIVLEGLAITGSVAGKAQSDVSAWLQRLGIVKC